MNAHFQPPSAPSDPERDRRYWRANLRLLVLLLAAWFTVSCGLSILLAPLLNQVRWAGVPLGFWFAQQGSIYVFVVLIAIYARAMDRLDSDYPAERDDSQR